MKRSICFVIVCTMLLAVFAVGIKANEVEVILNEKKIETSVPARIENGSTMVPMRAIFEALGMDVEWNSEEKSVTATKGKTTIKLVIGETVLTKNGEEAELNVAPFIEDGTTLVPVRAVAESVNAVVNWNDTEKKVEITTEDYVKDPDAWKENEGSIDVTEMKVTGEGIEVSGNVIKITKGGDFSVTGENDNVRIHVNTVEKVKLRLEGVKIKSEDAPIFFENSMKSFITIGKGTENIIEDGETYSVESKAAVFSNDDIEIKGEGKLTVISHSHHGIASDDDIKIEEGEIVVDAKAKDGIHANNTIKVKGGKITVTAYGDGIQSEEDIQIEAGEINVTTTGEVKETQKWGGRGNEGGRDWGNRGERPQMPPEGFNGERQQMPPEGMEGMTPPEGFGGERPQMPPEGFEGMMPPEGFEGQMPQEETAEDEATATKGIKAETDITITGGKIVVNSIDHAVHSAGTLNIKGGEMILSSQKGKGISAHGDVNVENGRIDITKSSEGLESKANLNISGGEISIAASDDGINAGGTGGRDAVNRQNIEAETGHDLKISGGKIYVNAQGDGLDANGRMIITGGDIVVEGPTNNGNGALDSGGSIKVDGGTIIALGASGMAETPDKDSKQASFRLVTEGNIASGSLIEISDARGSVIYSYTTVKTGNSIVFSSDKITKGETYKVKIGDSVHEIVMSEQVTNVGNGGFGGFGGRRW